MKPLVFFMKLIKGINLRIFLSVILYVKARNFSHRNLRLQVLFKKLSYYLQSVQRCKI